MIRKKRFLKSESHMDGMESQSVIREQLVSCVLCCWMEGGNNLASLLRLFLNWLMLGWPPQLLCLKGTTGILHCAVCEREREGVREGGRKLSVWFWYWLRFSVLLLTWHAWLFRSGVKYSEILRFVWIRRFEFIWISFGTGEINFR